MSTHELAERRWRLLDTGPRDGAFNMALDLVLLDEVRREAPLAPCLRLFAWDPPCLSLGHHQRIEEIDIPRCRRLGYDVVKRPTGGRAVLHDREITYSTAVPDGIFGKPLSVIESYKVLSQGLIEGLALLGIDSRLAPGSDAPNRGGSPACFASAAQCDLVSDGKKIIGSAQVRRRGGILQHGSIPLVDREEAERKVILGDQGEAIEGITNLADAAGRAITYEEAATAFTRGFATAFGLDFAPTDVTAEQISAAQAWMSRVRIE